MEIKTYLNQSVKNGYMLRWSRMPVNVYIAPMKFYSKQGEEGIYRNLVFKALKEWEDAAEGLISFRLVDTLLESQINIDWKRVERKALGKCIYNFDNTQRLYGAEVSIGLTEGLVHEQYNSTSEVYHTILHEIGHSLGLGHSPYESDIMYSPHRYGVVSLSRNDIYSIQCLYCLPPATPVKKIAAQYSVMTDFDIDMVIRKLDEKFAAEVEGETSGEVPKIKNNVRNLLDEAVNIGEIQKYNLMIQNVGLNNSMQKFFIDQHREKNK